MGIAVDIATYRKLPPDWRGTTFVVDVDRTYLATRFSTASGLLRIPGESFGDKQDIPGMAALLREIRRGPNRVSSETPLAFISASPTQLRRTIERKLTFDGIGFDATVFKDWRRLLSGLGIRHFRDQLGYKLTALLAHRAMLPLGAGEILIGDDLEADPLAFALYADLLAERLSATEVTAILRRLGRGSIVRDVLRLREAVGPVRGGVDAAFIRMERTQDPDDFLPYRGRIGGCRNALQIAAALWDRGHLGLDAVARVTGALLRRRDPAAQVSVDLRNAVARGLVSVAGGRTLIDRLGRHGAHDDRIPAPSLDPRWQKVLHTPPNEPWVPARHR